MASELEELIEKNAESARRIDQGIDEIGISVETVLAEHGRMRELLRWTRQTVHQAHHDGETDVCLKNTCSAITAALNDIPERGA